ncbi:MAG TPA: alpha/beta hydrolase [Pseudogracilibacillus sp.]|nr:alpha/beta hydrolase [Pseudogracilibacillus sp.]
MKGMEQGNFNVNGVRLNVWVGGEGKPLVLLHGLPQSAIMWRKVVPKLMENYTVICPDLRGYGDSQKPTSGYDKRTMALDIKLLMEELGFDTFAVVGHDRGARVAHRLALDHPDTVENITVLDIVPTHTMLSKTNKELAVVYWHWYFFQIPDVPEMLLNANPEQMFRYFMHNLSFNIGAIEEEALEEYERVFVLPGTIRAMLADYRAAATVDFEHDEADLEDKVSCPLLTIWGEHGKMDKIFDVLATWKEKASDVTGKSLPCGHFVAEEAHELLLDELLEFLQKNNY